MTSYFPAQYPGACGSCGERFEVGDTIYYRPGLSALMAVECCGDQTDAPAVAPEPESAVMPRGKKAADRCDTCWQVPASNGLCGCDQ